MMDDLSPTRKRRDYVETVLALVVYVGIIAFVIYCASRGG